MADETVADLVVALANPPQRPAAAARLAAHFGARAVLLLVRDPALGVMLPAPAMPRTLPPGASWRALLVRCATAGRHLLTVALPSGADECAHAVCGHDAALVVLGGHPGAGDLDTVEGLLKLLAALLGTELQVSLAEAEAAESRRAASRAQALSQSLENARAEASRLNIELRSEHERKDEFLAMLAHELRNPLSPIVNSIALLRYPQIDAGGRSAQLGVIERQVRQLTRLVDDLLDVSRVSRGRIDLRREHFDLRDALGAALEGARPALQAQRHTVDCDLAAGGPLPVFADRVRLTQIFTNLLNNAGKYTDPGGHVEVRAWRDGPQACVEVRDSGVGLAAESLARIFDLFVQVPVSLDRARGGLGIGLTLVRRLVELHGGSVSAASDGLGRGSVFAVQLPIATDVVAPTPAAPAGQDPGPRGDGLRVLVVDDNSDAADSLAALLALMGHQVEVAYTSADAVERAARVGPDLVLLDLGLPEMDGYEVAALMRATLASQPRLVALTGYGSPQDRLRTRQAGFDEHRVKPLTLDDLEDVLANAAAGASAMIP